MARLSDKFKELSDLYDKESDEYEKWQYEQVRCPNWKLYHCGSLCDRVGDCKTINNIELCRKRMKETRGQIDYYSFINIQYIITALRFFETEFEIYRQWKKEGNNEQDQ